MAEEVGIVMSLYDRVSPTLKAIAGNSRAFDKTLDELEASLKAYDKAQETMTKRAADLKKALAETDQQVKDAQKSYKKLHDEASKNALDTAIDRQTELKRKLTETESSLKANAKAYDSLYEKARKAASGMQTVSTEASKAENRAATIAQAAPAAADGSVDILSALGQAGAWSMVGDMASQWAGTFVSSLGGSEVGTLFAGALSGAGSGAAIGTMIAPGVGTVVGAGLGGLVGLVSGESQVFEQKDDAFKAFVQETTQEQMEALYTSIASGSDTAAQRELDSIAFNQLLGNGVGDSFLADLREMAADTPMEYGDLTQMSRSLATGFGDDPDRMLELLEGIGNAGSAVGTDASGMTYMAQVMSRMQSSDKFSREDLDAFQDRGIDVLSMLSSALKVTEGEIYDMITESEIGGRQAITIIQQGLDQYAGAMDKMAQTYSGLESTLADAQTEMDNAYGEGYNETRAQGMQEEIDFLNGYSGDLMKEANRAMGAWQAELENTQEQFQREALAAVMSGAKTTLFSEEAQEELNELWASYQKAEIEGNAAEQGRLLAEARVMAQLEYNTSEGAQLMVEYETQLAAWIRDNAATNDAYWDAGHRKGQEYGKGLAAAMTEIQVTGPQIVAIDGEEYYYRPGYGYVSSTPSSHAFGLDRVPYDNYPAILHEGERVLTAREARAMDRASAMARQDEADSLVQPYVLQVESPTLAAEPSAPEPEPSTYGGTVDSLVQPYVLQAEGPALAAEPAAPEREPSAYNGAVDSLVQPYVLQAEGPALATEPAAPEPESSSYDGAVDSLAQPYVLSTGHQAETPEFRPRLVLGDLTARAQAAAPADSQPSRVINIDISGNSFGAGQSAEEIAQRLADLLELKLAAGVL